MKKRNGSLTFPTARRDLLLPLRASGHGGGTTLTALIEQDLDELSFCCWALDIAPPSPAKPSGVAQ